MKLTADGGGYLIAYCGNGNRKSVHRLVAEAFITKPEGKDYIDHINRNCSDNSLANLRWVTRSENNRNRRQKGSSQYKGVSWYKPDSCWTARLNLDKPYNLGYFSSEHEAALVYNWLSNRLLPGQPVLNANIQGFLTQELSQRIMVLLERHGW